MNGFGPLELAAATVAATAAGIVNALAGGGTLLTFPVLTALGLPALAANVTNTVALCPGHIGATFAQRKALAGQRALLALLIPAGILGGLAGGVLLLGTGERTFRQVVPLLLLLSSLLLAAQDRVRSMLLERSSRRGQAHRGHAHWAAPLVAGASIYGGYFGAGLGVVLLAALGVVLDESLPRLNALKQVVALAVNVAAAMFFVFSDQIDWTVAAAMAAGALAGGAIGGRLATRVDAIALRRAMVAIGLVLAAVYLVR